jgi:hypothetical protein
MQTLGLGLGAFTSKSVVWHSLLASEVHVLVRCDSTPLNIGQGCISTYCAHYQILF